MQPIELNRFFEYRFLSRVTYSPDGRRAAFAVAKCQPDTNDYGSCLYLYDGSVRQLTSGGKESSFLWEDDTHLLFFAMRGEADQKRAEEGEALTCVYRLDITGGEAQKAWELPLRVREMKQLPDGRYLVTAMTDLDHPDEYRMTKEEKQTLGEERKQDKDYEVLEEIPFWFNGSGVISHRRASLFLFDPKAETKLIPLTEPAENLGAMEILDGCVLLDVQRVEGMTPVQGCHLVRVDLGTLTRTTVKDDAELTVSGIFKTGKNVLLTAAPGDRVGLNENDRVWTLNIATGETELLYDMTCNMYNSTGSDCRYGGGTERAVRGDALYYLATREGNAELHCLSADGAIRAVVTRVGSADCFTVSEHSDKALLVGMYDMQLQELYEADLETGETRQLTHLNEGALKDRYVAKPEPLTVHSEGLEIGGWVLKPYDFDPAKTYPAVLDIHGGPKTVYGPIFYHEMQLWAGMGYFVFFCNPKGSDGRDNEFSDIRGQYGETDYRNLMDFTDAVLKAWPQIDRERVCETGGSYGGFMTNWIIGHTDRFCCTASQRSISNWLSFAGVSDIGYYFAPDQNAATLEETPEKLWDRSPLKYADRVKTPTLFIHSDEDYRCPLEQGLQMFTALKAHGVPARLCLFHGENHELSRSGKPKHRERRLQEITNWFECWNGKDKNSADC